MDVMSALVSPAPAGSASCAVPQAGRKPMNPYLAGFGLGVVLLLAFLFMGRGLGATGAVGSIVAWVTGSVAPDWTAANPALKGYFADPPATNWLVWLMLGAFAGALFSALLGRRIRLRIERGPHLTVPARLAFAFLGGAVAAAGAKLAKGCTSGQALTGGAQLNVGSWVFMLAVFAGAYLLAYFVRRAWR
jgi:uncharacterized membrane protein YedE/YeeE